MIFARSKVKARLHIILLGLKCRRDYNFENLQEVSGTV